MKPAFKALIGLVLVSVAACGGSPSPDRMSADVDHLASVLPILEEMRVIEFTNKDWCRQLAFDGGLYSEADEGTSTCVMFAGNGGPFDDQAERAFARIAEKLGDSGVGIYDVSVEYAEDGSVSGARFDFDVVSLPPFRAYTYVYSVVQPEMRQDGDAIDTPINGNWHLESSDWM